MTLNETIWKSKYKEVLILAITAPTNEHFNKAVKLATSIQQELSKDAQTEVETQVELVIQHFEKNSKDALIKLEAV